MSTLRIALVATAFVTVCSIAHADPPSHAKTVGVAIDIADAATGRRIAQVKTEMDPKPITPPCQSCYFCIFNSSIY